MEKVLNTGEEVQPGAAAGGEETEVNDESTELFVEEEIPDISLDELINGTDEGNAEEGSGQPAESETGQGPQAATETKPTDREFSQADVDAIVRKRLKQQADSIEKKHAAEVKRNAEIDAKTKEYLKEHPNTELSEDMVKSIIRMQSGAQEASDKLTAEEFTEQRLAAWKESLQTEEPLLRAKLNDPNFSIANAINEKSDVYNPVFHMGLKMQLRPIQALELAEYAEKTYAAKLEAAKAAGEKEVLDKIKANKGKTVTPVSSGKGTGRTTSAEDWIKNATMEQLDAQIAEAERRGARGVRVG